MKNYIRILFAILALSTLNHPLSTVLAQGTAFTYQGQLQNNGNPANGTYNLTFTLFATNSGGSVIAGPVTNSTVAVVNGLFTVMIDFGASVWNGQTNWLEIGVETNNAASFATLAPRQQVTPVPYAITAENLNGTIPASQLTSIGNTDGGSDNFFVGPSGNATTFGDNNTANGVLALSSETFGSYNTANGYQALYSNTTGTGNTADGAYALISNISGSYNTANGSDALQNNTNGKLNTADGVNALLLNISGSDNTANGSGALVNNTNGSYNTAVGSFSLYENSSGTGNTALGYEAGYNITTGNNNIDIGNQGLSTDANIIRIGDGQTQAFIAGVISGNGAGLTNLNVSAAQLTSIGNTNGGFDNFFVGSSGNATTRGYNNTANGIYALSDDTTGFGNTANGFAALDENTDGCGNTANGVGALQYNTSGLDNTADGYQALEGNTNGSFNIALGAGAGDNISTGNNNIDIGNPGLSTDNNIIRIGTPGSQTSTYLAGPVYDLGGGIVRPANPGWFAADEFDDISGSAFRGFVGMDGVGLTGNTNQMYVGTYTSHQLAFYTANQPRMIITPTGNVGIGNASPTNLLVVGSAYCNGTTWVNGSDRNSKQDFSLVNPRNVLAKVTAMPITEWQYKIEPGLEHIGPMAQDFHAAFGLNGSDDKHISTVDEGGVALAAIQGLNQKLEEQAKEKDAENAELKRENNSLSKRLDDLEAEVKSLAQKN